MSSDDVDEEVLIKPENLSTESLAKLRATCEQYRAPGSQIKAFKIRVECGGSYTFYDQEMGEYELPNSVSITAKASTKDGRYATEPFYSSTPTDTTGGQCRIWTRYRVSGPQGYGIGVDITDCEDLIPDNLAIICKDELEEYCEDNLRNRDNESSQETTQLDDNDDIAAADNEGMCTVVKEMVYNTCTTY